MTDMREMRVSDMNGVTERTQCGLVKGLAQRRMHMDGAGNVLQHRAHFERAGESG